MASSQNELILKAIYIYIYIYVWIKAVIFVGIFYLKLIKV